MGIAPIIHCLVDQEPTSFHQSDIDEATFSFAINLGFECQSNAKEPADVKADETAAEAQFRSFLDKAQGVRFFLFALPPLDGKLGVGEAIASISQPPALGKPDDLYKWLGGRAPEPGERYWTTAAPHLSSPSEVVVEAESAAATYCLRAAQSWNAPVAHAFGLTHVVRVARKKVESKNYVILPFFDAGSPADITFTANHQDPVAVDFSYESVFGPTLCRTNPIGEGLTKVLDPSTIDPALTSDGYLKVYADAETLRRTLVWFEERAATVLAANPALHSRAPNPDKDSAFEDLFGIQVVSPQTDGKTVREAYWGSIVWYVVARLVSTLDRLVVALLKPALHDGKAEFEANAEGPVLAPLISEMLAELRALPESFKLDELAFDKSKVTTAVRSALTASPLTILVGPPATGVVAQPSPEARKNLAGALRQIFDIKEIDGQKPESEREFISAILARYADGGGARMPAKVEEFALGLENRSVATVSRVLLDLEHPLQEEAGAEAAILKIFESAGAKDTTFAKAVAAKYVGKLGRTGDAGLEAAVEQAFTAAWMRYRALLEGPFNGAEAARRATGASFLRAVLDHSQQGAGSLDSRVREAVASSEFFSRRFAVSDLTTHHCFDAIASALRFPGDDVLSLRDKPEDIKGRRDNITEHLAAAFVDAAAPLQVLNAPGARFIPDGAPQPLAIQVAANIDGSRIDEFAKHFNGLAIALQRVDDLAGSNRWAHANLADLGWTKSDKPEVDGAIHPMTPAVSDGRGPMFIEYHGFPFADPATDERIIDDESTTGLVRQGAFYQRDPHAPSEKPEGFAALPRLAYGRKFRSFGFVTTNAGVLPLALQASAGEPWMPKPAPDDAPKDALDEIDYQRRTAIAQMSVTETSLSAPRLGAEIPGVRPLAKDYPRSGLHAEDGAPGVRDILRESDGGGRMVAGRDFEWLLDDIRFTGDPAKLVLRFFERQPSGPDDPGAQFVIRPTNAGFPEKATIKIKIEFAPERRLVVTCPDAKVEPEFHVMAGGDTVAGWLRLELSAKPGKKAAMSFADVGAGKSDNVSAPLLLLAPTLPSTAPQVWKDDLSKAVKLEVVTPRVGYLDFERWFANADLAKDLLASLKELEDARSVVERFEEALLTAYVMRHLEPKLGRLLDMLPDPAVKTVRIELVHHDALAPGAQATPVKSVSIDIQKWLPDFLQKHFVERAKWTQKDLFEFLQALHAHFQFKIEITSGKELGLKLADRLVSAAVPKGVVARVSIDSLVSSDRFEETKDPDDEGKKHPAVFHSGLKQYATRRLSDNCLAFPAAAILIETMYDGMAELKRKSDKKERISAIALAAAMIEVEAIERARKYNIVTRDSAAGEMLRCWRLLGEIDVTTQRWRPTGRPIYHYVNPRAHLLEGKEDDASDRRREISHPALALDLYKKPQGEPLLAQFESEAFFNRSDADAKTTPPQVLAPLPARTVLQEEHWDPESATYFRHRFTLRSRYAGALKNRGDGEAIAWPTREPDKTKETEVQAGPFETLETPAHGWTMRVAMLAAWSRSNLTRPQLRALIPLTTAPDGGAVDRLAPPVAAILQEPPFARGGLADRIASEVKTGFGYGFAEPATPSTKDIAEERVEILDSRKEAGPDPRLDFRPLKDEAAFGLAVTSEGPIGLTFDDIDAPAPAYANAMYSLAPVALHGKKPPLEEMFLGVAMRRYIDPHWTTCARAGEGTSRPEIGLRNGRLDAAYCWWIDVDLSGPLPNELLSYWVEGNRQDYPLLVIEQGSDGGLAVKASTRAIDGYGPTSRGLAQDSKTILKVDKALCTALSVLHQPIAPGRYSTSIFVSSGASNIGRGEIGAPLMLASFEWSPYTEKTSEGDSVRPPPTVDLAPATGCSAYTAMASAPTFMRWTKTNRDFDFLYIPKIDEKGQWTRERRHVRELVAALDPKHHGVTLELDGVEKHPVWLCPSTFDNPYPVHVHRHLAVITSRILEELGRPVEVFRRTALLEGCNATLVAPDGSIQSGKEVVKPREQLVRVVEFETPAQILCDGGVLAPDKYKTAYFDLVSTGFGAKIADAGGRIRLHFRIVGPPAHQRAFSGIEISLWLADSADRTKIKLKWSSTDDAFVVGVRTTLRQNKANLDAPAIITVQALRSNGTQEPIAAAIEPPKLDPGKETSRGSALRAAANSWSGLFVSIKAIGSPAAGEFWTDVSLLHSADDNANSPFDFDWLFSSGSATEPALSVSPAGLNMMQEAQARVVAVSPPIPIVRH